MVASVWEKRSIVHREGRLLSQPRVGRCGAGTNPQPGGWWKMVCAADIRGL